MRPIRGGAAGRIAAALRGVGPGVRAVLAALRTSLGGETVPPPRAPYVQNVSAGSATVCWVGAEPERGVVEYGEGPDLETKATDDLAVRRHAVTLGGLAPGKAYRYRVDGAATGRFRTAPEGDAPFAFAVIGDSGNGGKHQMAVAGLLGKMEPDLILHTGDVVYPSGEDRHYDKRFFAPYRALISEVPLFPVIGNHDVQKDDGAAFLKNFHPPRNNPEGTARYYSFDWGDAHFVALDSELYHEDAGGDREEQKLWLEEDLAATPKPWRFAFLHRPLYSSSRHGGDRRIREDLEPVLSRHGVHVVFSGHDHAYERTLPVRGVTYVVTGGGGKRLYGVRRDARTAASASAHHATLVRVRGDHLTLEAVKPDGTILDRFDLRRPPAPKDGPASP